MNRDIEARKAGGRVIISILFDTEWEYFRSINARFEGDRRMLVMSGSDGTVERTVIPDSD